MSTPNKEPCPRCGKMLKPLSAKVKAYDLKTAQRDPLPPYLVNYYEENGPAGTRRHVCKPTEGNGGKS
jgi:hypothetical protein